MVGPGPEPVPARPHELHGCAADEIAWFGREQDRRGAKHTRLQGRRRGDGHPQIGESSIQLIRTHGRTSVRGEDVVYRAEVEFGGASGDKRFVLAGTMFALPNEPGHRVAANGLRIAAHAPQQAAIGGGDDPPAYLGHCADRQLQFADRDFADLDVDAALGCDARDPILGVLGEWAADEVPPVVNPVDDQPARASWPSPRWCRGHSSGRPV